MRSSPAVATTSSGSSVMSKRGVTEAIVWVKLLSGCQSVGRPGVEDEPVSGEILHQAENTRSMRHAHLIRGRGRCGQFGPVPPAASKLHLSLNLWLLLAQLAERCQEPLRLLRGLTACGNPNYSTLAAEEPSGCTTMFHFLFFIKTSSHPSAQEDPHRLQPSS